ncbi:unnamed protein product [Fraxinus pennsylvanica]|uniref:Uncharacterized protein n=1 Tax=Fraxinus pennsylvanica TaxID=56036 RepID=A0AAD1Z1A3_9LAMI|nr:unnamed protein product [Fraxinus pennsylvanica]
MSSILVMEQDAKLNLSDSNRKVFEVSESSMSVIPLGGSNAQNCEISTEFRKSEMQLENDGSKSLHMDAKINSAYINYQVSDVKSELRVQVISDSVSAESVSITEKNELKVAVVANDVKVLEHKPEMVQSLSGYVVTDDGDDSMEDDVLESKQMYFRSNCDEIREKGDKAEIPTMKEEDILESKLMNSKSNFDEMKKRGEKPEMHVVNEKDYVEVADDDKIVGPLVFNA